MYLSFFPLLNYVSIFLPSIELCIYLSSLYWTMYISFFPLVNYVSIFFPSIELNIYLSSLYWTMYLSSLYWTMYLSIFSLLNYVVGMYLFTSIELCRYLSSYLISYIYIRQYIHLSIRLLFFIWWNFGESINIILEKENSWILGRWPHQSSVEKLGDWIVMDI